MPVSGRSRFLAILVVIAFLGGCRVMSTDTPAPAPVALAALPEDFALDLVVQTGRRPRSFGPAPRWSYILFPDGTLHAGEAAPHVIPPEVRTLSPVQVETVYAEVHRLGLAGDPVSLPPRSLQNLAPFSGETLVGITVAADGARWSIVEPTTSERGIAMMALEDELAALAWMVAPQRVETVIVPRRYDLGPDPYARFR